MRRRSLFSILVRLTFVIIFVELAIVLFQAYQTTKHPIVNRNENSNNLFNYVFQPLANQKPSPYEIENLPSIYFGSVIFNSNFNKTCARFPHLHDVVFTNDHWQKQKTSNGTFHLLGAYLDDRPAQWVVRILGLFDQVNPNQTFYCQIWSKIKRRRPKIVPAGKFLRIFHANWNGNGKELFQPYLINCPVPRNRVPMSVSLVEFICDNPTNNLRVEYKTMQENKKNFFVCVKGLSFPYEDKSIRLVEWIELLFILGAEKIVFYLFNVHPQIVQVLDYYASQKKIDVYPFTLVGGASNSPYVQKKFLNEQHTTRRLQEVLPYNDCFYRNFKNYKFAVLLDIDEVIMPSEGQTWTELMGDLNKAYPGKASYMARHAYFMDNLKIINSWRFRNVPPYMHMVKNTYRTRTFSKKEYYVKGFHSTTNIVTLHNHHSLDCLNEKDCWNNTVYFEVEKGYLHHYRSGCIKADKDCEKMKADLVLDTKIWHYKDELIRRVQNVGQDLGLLKCQNVSNQHFNKCVLYNNNVP